MSELREALACICGRSLTAVRFEEHVFRERRSLVSIWLGFGAGGIKLRTAPDGWGLAVETRPPQAADLGEHGRIEVRKPHDVAELPVGRVESAWAVVSSESPVPVGVRWRVQGARAVCVYSYDDELMVRAEPGDELGAITFEDICPTP